MATAHTEASKPNDEDADMYEDLLHPRLWTHTAEELFVGCREYFNDEAVSKVVTVESCPLLWMKSLGHGFGILQSLMHRCAGLGYFSDCDRIYLPGVFVMVTFHIERTLYDLVPPPPLSAPEPLVVLTRPCELWCGMGYIGNRSYQRLFKATLAVEGRQADDIFTASYYAVSTAPESQLASFKAKCLKAPHRQGQCYTKPKLSHFSQDDLGELYSSTMIVTEECIDEFNHVNYKVYIIKTFDTLRRASEARKIRFQVAKTFHQAKVKDVATVYEKETVLGQALTFIVFRPLEESRSRLVVATYRGSERVAYSIVDFYETILLNLNSYL